MIYANKSFSNKIYIVLSMRITFTVYKLFKLLFNFVISNFHFIFIRVLMKRFSRKTYSYPYVFLFILLIIINCPFACTIFKRENYFNSESPPLRYRTRRKQSLEKLFDLRWIELSKASRNPTIWSNVPSEDKWPRQGHRKRSQRRARFCLPLSNFRLSPRKFASTDPCLRLFQRIPFPLSRIKIIQRDHFLSIKHPFLHSFPHLPK